MNLADLHPFEICSIRPPTENSSLTFRLTRNCYWNRCAFCPVYKLGAKYSRRTLDEVLADIEHARVMDEYLQSEEYYNASGYMRTAGLASRIREAQNLPPDEPEDQPDERTRELASRDERILWFLQWFKDRPTIEDSLTHLMSWRAGGGDTCFLGDADNLVLKPDFMCTVLAKVKKSFPDISRFTIYGRLRTAAHMRTVDELRAFHDGGLDRVHYGLESGSDRVLELVTKGVTSSEQKEGGIKTREAGLSCSVYVMPGLGGVTLSEDHARGTADVINAIRPDFVRLRTLEIFPGTPLEEKRRDGSFVELSEEAVVREIRALIAGITAETEITSDSAVNLLSTYGRLPRDRERMLASMDRYLALTPLEKIRYSLQERIESFYGQYGCITDDIWSALEPLSDNGVLFVNNSNRDEALAAIRLIRGKLMP